MIEKKNYENDMKEMEQLHIMIRNHEEKEVFYQKNMQQIEEDLVNKINEINDLKNNIVELKKFKSLLHRIFHGRYLTFPACFNKAIHSEKWDLEDYCSNKGLTFIQNRCVYFCPQISL